MEILGQIQAHILDPNFPLSAILREAKVLASQLESAELAEWVTNELDGYREAAKLPDYRVLATRTTGTWTNNFWLVNSHGVPMYKIKDDNLTELLTRYRAFDGIRTIEELASMKDEDHLFLPADIVALVNHYVSEGGYGYSQLHFAVRGHDFAQILDSVRNRLLDFVLKLSKRWDPQTPPPPQAQVSQLVQLAIYSTPEGGNVTVFDQRGQQVQYQFNAAGNINISGVQSAVALAEELGKLRGEVELAKNAGAIPPASSSQATDAILKAAEEAAAPAPRKQTIIDNIGKARDILKDFTAAAQLVAALAQAAAVVSKLLK